MKKLIEDFLSDEEGATAIEYGLIAALIGVAVIAAVRAVGTNVSRTFSAIESALPG
jgi:pilus assembly protein Flp/PilA